MQLRYFSELNYGLKKKKKRPSHSPQLHNRTRGPGKLCSELLKVAKRGVPFIRSAGPYTLTQDFKTQQEVLAVLFQILR